MKLLPVLLSLSLLSGCVKHPSLDSLNNGKWEGSFNINSPCDSGGYTGSPLMACIVLSSSGGGVVTAAVDWDSSSLREECDYFSFHGTFDKSTLTLARNDDPDEADDRLNLQFNGHTITGTFQVHPSCDEWPVKLERVR